MSRNACSWPWALEPLATIWPLSLIAVVVEGEPGAGRDQSALGTTRSFIPLPM